MVKQPLKNLILMNTHHSKILVIFLIVLISIFIAGIIELQGQNADLLVFIFVLCVVSCSTLLIIIICNSIL